MEARKMNEEDLIGNEIIKVGDFISIQFIKLDRECFDLGVMRVTRCYLQRKLIEVKTNNNENLVIYLGNSNILGIYKHNKENFIVTCSHCFNKLDGYYKSGSYLCKKCNKPFLHTSPIDVFIPELEPDTNITGLESNLD